MGKLWDEFLKNYESHDVEVKHGIKEKTYKELKKDEEKLTNQINPLKKRKQELLQENGVKLNKRGNIALFDDDFNTTISKKRKESFDANENISKARKTREQEEYQNLNKEISKLHNQRAYTRQEANEKYAKYEAENLNTPSKLAKGFALGWWNKHSWLTNQDEDTLMDENGNYTNNRLKTEGEILDEYQQANNKGLLKTAYDFSHLLGESASQLEPGGEIGYFADIASDKYNENIRNGVNSTTAFVNAVGISVADAIKQKIIGAGAKRLGGLDKSIDTDNAISKLIENSLKKYIPSNSLNKIVSKTGAGFVDEFTDSFAEQIWDNITFGKKWNEGLDDPDFWKQALYEGALGAGMGATYSTVGTIATPKSQRASEQAVYDYERRTGNKMSEFNKNTVDRIVNLYDSIYDKTPTSQEILDSFERIKTNAINDFQTDSLDKFPTLDDAHRPQFNEMLNDMSQVIYDTGVNIRLDPTQTKIVDWDNGTLVLNPTQTAEPLKNIVLHEISKQTVDSDTQNYIINKLKEDGVYETYKNELLATGEFDEFNVDQEIVAQELDAIFQSENEIKELSEKDKGLFKNIKDTFNTLTGKLTNNRNTRDALYFREVNDRINSLYGEGDLNDLRKIQGEPIEYSETAKKTLENLKNKGYEANTFDAQLFNDFVSKISNDKGIEFDFTNNEELKKNKLNVKNRVVNGYNDNGKIVVNMDSPRALNTIVGHEITHSLEKSKYYKDLQNALFKYAKDKGEYDSRYNDIKELYKNVKNADIDSELTADLVGDYIFTDSKFINDLSKKDKNLLTRILDELRYIWGQLTGTKQQKELDKAIKLFTKAYNDNVATPSGFKYSLVDITETNNKYLEGKSDLNSTFGKTLGEVTNFENATDNLGNKLTKEVYEKYKNSKAIDSKGRLIVGYNYSSSIFFGAFSTRRYSKDVLWLGDSYPMVKSYNSVSQLPYLNKIKSVEEAQKLVKQYNDTWSLKLRSVKNIVDKRLIWGTNTIKEIIKKYGKENIDKAYKNSSYDKTYVDYAKSYLNNEKKYVLAYNLYGGEDFDYSVFNNEEQMFKELPEYFRNDSGRYGYITPNYMNIVNPYVVDSKGKLAALKAEEVVERDKIDEALSILKDKNKVNKMKDLIETSRDNYRSSQNARNELYRIYDDAYYRYVYTDIFNEEYKNNQFVRILCSPNLDYPIYKSIYEHFGEQAPKPTDKIGDYLKFEDKSYIKDNFDKDMTFEEFYLELQKLDFRKDVYDNELTYFYDNIDKIMELNSLKPDDTFKLIRLSEEGVENIEKEFTKYLNTDSVVEKVLKMNREQGTNYDGVIFRNIQDYAEDWKDIPELQQYIDKEKNLGGFEDLPPGNVFVLFNQEARNYASNEEPTDIIDARYSLSQQNKEYGDYNVYGRDFAKRETEINDQYKSNEKLPETTKPGTYIEPTNPIDTTTKKGKKYLQQISGEGVKSTLLKTKAKNYTSFVDKLNPIQQIADASGNTQLYAKYNNRGMSNGMGQYQIGTAQTDINGREIGKSLNNIWKPIEDANLTTQFDDYLAHRLNEERYDKVPVWDESITPEMSREIIDNYESKYPQFKAWADEIYKFNDNQLQKMIDAGLSKENARDWLYKNYVTISRDLAPKTNPLVQNAKGVKVNSPIRKAKGGNADIRPMKEAMARQTLLTENAIADNIAGQELLNVLGGTVGDTNTFLTQDLEGNNNALMQNEDGTYNYTVYKNGVPVTMQITKEVADAIRPTKRGEWEELAPFKAIRKVSKLQRTLLTDKNPLFIFTNFFKDIGDAPLNSKYSGGQFYFNYPIAVAKMLKKDSDWKQYVAKGGKENTYFDTKKGEVTLSKNAIKRTAQKFSQLIENANKFIEQAPRFNEYLLTLQNGGTLDEALYNSAEVTTNFARGGEITKALNRNGFNFLNASVQGFDKQIRNFTKQPGAKGYVQLLAKVAVFGIAPAMLNHMLLEDDDDYEELPDYIKDNYYLFKTGDNKFIRIPKGRVMSIFGTSARHTYETAKGNESILQGLKDTGEQLVNNVAPNNPIENNVISPLLSVKNNKSWNGSAIVTTRLQNLPDSEQYDEKTSSIAKWLGKTFNKSPKKIDYVLDQYTGAIGDFVLPMTTPSAESEFNSIPGKLIASPFVSKFTADSTISSKYVSEFYDTKDKLEKEMKLYSSIDESEESFEKSLQAKYLANVNEEVAELYAQKREVQNSDLDDKTKYNQARDIQRKIDDLTKFALQDYTEGYYTDSYGIVGDKEYHITYSQGKFTWSKVDEKTKKKQEEYAEKYDMSPEVYYGMDGLTKSKIAGGSYLDYVKMDSKLKAITDKTSNDKEATFEYVNKLDMPLVQKAMYIKMHYPSYNEYNKEIFDWVDANSYDEDEMKAILIKLGYDYNKNTKQYSWK